MSTPLVAVLDYGIGNLYSVTRSFEASGATVRLTANQNILFYNLKPSDKAAFEAILNGSSGMIKRSLCLLVTLMLAEQSATAGFVLE